MLKRLWVICIALLLCSAATAQTVTLTFSGRDAQNHYVQLNRVTVTNLTRGWQETLEWPDTILTLQAGTDIQDVETMCTSSLQLSQNTPNPFNGTTDVNLTVADIGSMTLEIADGNGRVVEANNYSPLPTGTHQFRITLSQTGIYMLTARQNGKTSSIKMVCNGAGNTNRIDYAGIVETPYYDVSTMATDIPISTTPKSLIRGFSDNPFTAGDQMTYVGYATFSGSEYESHTISQPQQGSESFQLQFDQTLPAPVDGQPCPSTPTLTDIDGNVYNTVQLGSQCWMQQNLRTTHFANGNALTLGTEHSATEKYYYYPNGDDTNAATYGLLYNRAAVMNGESASNNNPSNVQGVCPDGVPSAV